MTWWWSWLLTAVGVAGIYFAGSGKKLGWAIGISAQVLWVGYAVATQQWGFLVSAGAYGSVYIRNWVRWSRSTDRGDNEAARAREDSCSRPSGHPEVLDADL